MSDKKLSRRALLRSGAAASGTMLVGALAGCNEDTSGNGDGNGNGSGNGNGDGNGSGNGNGNGTGNGNAPTPSTIVPGAAEMVATIDIAGIADDQNIRSIGNAFISKMAEMEGYDGPQNIDEAFDSAENTAGLDPNSLNGMTVFGQVSQSAGAEAYGGGIMATSLTEADITAAMDEAEASYEQSEYGGKTIYTFEGDAVDAPQLPADTGVMGVLGDGRFAFGTQAVVEDIIDVVNGDAEGLSGDLGTHFENTRSGYVQFASLLPEDSSGSGGQNPMQGVDYASGSFYSAGSSLGLEVVLHAQDGETATQLSRVFNQQLQQMSEDQQDQMAQDLVDAITIEASGSDVVITFEETASQLESYAEQFAQIFMGSMSGGMGGGMGGTGGGEIPRASFSFSYDSGAQTLEITHNSGDSIKANSLMVDGSNLGAGNRGPWQMLSGASASGEVDGQAAIVDGDSVTLGANSEQEGVPPSYRVRLIYVGGNQTTTLATNRGPEN